MKVGRRRCYKGPLCNQLTINSPIETLKNKFTQFENKELFEDMIALDNIRVKMNSQICKRTECDADSQHFDLRLLTPYDAITILRVKLINEQFLPKTGELRLLYATTEYSLSNPMDVARSQIKETRKLDVDDVIKALCVIISPIETPNNEFTQFENKEIFKDRIALDNRLLWDQSGGLENVNAFYTI
ncbi:hypothetical protein LXL04_023348 [Taraxacum kok-saghyz]